MTVLSRFDPIPERDRRTDRQADRIAISISVAQTLLKCMEVTVG